MPFATHQWDPYTILAIDKSRTRCYGWAPSMGRTCNNPIAVANHSEAQRLLVKASRCSPSSENIARLLEQIAHLLICRRNNHQNQSQAVVQRWEDKIDDYLDLVNEDEEEETDSTASEEEVVDTGLRRQMTELHGILRRVETALAANLAEQRRTQPDSSSTSSQSDFIEVTVSDHASDTAEPPSSPHGREETTHAQPSQLNLDHIQELVRQLSMERETSQQRASSESTIEGDDNDEDEASSAPTRSDSPQTVIGIEDEVQHREQPPAGVPAATATSTPETVEHDGRSESSSTVVSAISVPAQRREPELPGEDRSRFAFATLSSDDLNSMDGLLRDNAGGKESFFQAWLHKHVQRAKCPTNSLWLITLTLYLGIVLMWCLLNPFPFRAGLLTLEGPASTGDCLIAEQFRLPGPAMRSLSTIER